MSKLRSLRHAATARERIVLLCFVVWASVIVGRLAQVMIVERQALLDEMARESAIRGNLAAGEDRPDALPTLAKTRTKAY